MAFLRPERADGVRLSDLLISGMTFVRVERRLK